MTKTSRFLEVSEEGSEGLKYRQLIKGLEQKAWEDDHEAQSELYGNEAGSKTFDMLKSRAKDQLVNMIFQLDTQKKFKSSYDRAYFLTCKNLMSGVILFNQRRMNAAESQLKLSIKTAKQYQFTDLEIVALRLLRNIASFEGASKQFNEFSKRINQTMKLLSAELYAEELDQELILEVINSLSLGESWNLKVKENYEQLQSMLKDNDTYRVRMSTYRVGIRYYDSIYDYNNAIRVATECEEYLKSNPHLMQKVRLGEMSLNKLYAALHLRDYQRGSIFAEDCKVFYNPGTINWMVFLEYYFLLSLHTNKINQAIDIYHQVTSHQSFKSYPPQNKEKWKIFEAFLVYIKSEKDTSIKKFNIPKFINEVPLYSKDKAGYNLSIIIAQIILSLKVGDYERIVEKAEALKLYSSRYIRKDKNPRSYYFIKMLQVMIKYDFDGNKTEQIANKFFVKLKESHLGEQSELESLEVIPYDILWPELINKLKNNNQ